MKNMKRLKYALSLTVLLGEKVDDTLGIAEMEEFNIIALENVNETVSLLTDLLL